MSSAADLWRRIAELERQVNVAHVQERPRFVGARATQSSAQSISNNTVTIVNFSTVDDDPYSLVTTGGFWKFTAPLAGRYMVAAQVLFASTLTWADGEGSSISLYKNGVEVAVLDRDDVGSSLATYRRLGGTDYVQLAKNDYIDIRVVQNSGAALALHTSALYNRIAISLLG